MELDPGMLGMIEEVERKRKAQRKNIRVKQEETKEDSEEE